MLIVGCGRIAGGIEEHRLDDEATPISHAGAFRAHSGFDVTACVEPDAERRESFMRYWDVPTGFADIDDALRSETSYDVISICSPTTQHLNHLDAGLKAMPLAVLCEKPICADPSDARDVVSRYRAAGVPLCVNYIRRWVPELSRLRDEFAAGEWGELINASAYYSKGLMHNGSHMIDLLHFLLGSLRVVDVFDARIDHDIDDPSICARLAAGNGAPVVLLCGDERRFQHIELSLLFENGRIDMEDLGRTIRLRRAAPDSRIPAVNTLRETERLTPDTPAAINAAVDNIYRHIHSAAPLESDGTSALDTLETCHAIRAAWDRTSTAVAPTAGGLA